MTSHTSSKAQLVIAGKKKKKSGASKGKNIKASHTSTATDSFNVTLSMKNLMLQ